MSTLETQAREYAANNPRRDGASWSGWCASLMYRFNEASQAYGSAMAAGDAANIESSDPGAAPIGAFHYWAGANGDGHVAQDVQGRGRLLFMASSKVTEALGEGIGMVSFADYQSRAGLPYRGWSQTYGVNPSRDAEDLGSMNDPQPSPAPTPSGTTYTVVERDTLWDIAGAHLGDPNRWPEVYDLNRATIGENPDLIFPGQVLTLP